MAINHEYLDILYTLKVEAEQKLLTIEHERNHILSADTAEHIIEIRELKITCQKELINHLRIVIKKYLHHHTN